MESRIGGIQNLTRMRQPAARRRVTHRLSVGCRLSYHRFACRCHKPQQVSAYERAQPYACQSSSQSLNGREPPVHANSPVCRSFRRQPQLAGDFVASRLDFLDWVIPMRLLQQRSHLVKYLLLQAVFAPSTDQRFHAHTCKSPRPLIAVYQGGLYAQMD